MTGRAQEELTEGHVDLDDAELHRRDAPLSHGIIAPISSSEFTKPPRVTNKSAGGLPVRRRPEVGGHSGSAIPRQSLAGGIGWGSLGAGSRAPPRRAGRPIPQIALERPRLCSPIGPRCVEKAAHIVGKPDYIPAKPCGLIQLTK